LPDQPSKTREKGNWETSRFDRKGETGTPDFKTPKGERPKILIEGRAASMKVEAWIMYRVG